MSNQDSLLSRIEIAKPCSADWENMKGDERERACQLCHLNVYNISAMTKGEAESFLRERLPQGRVCARLFRRADGTIITDNCPRGLRAARNAARLIKQRVAAVASMVLASLAPLASQAQNNGSGSANQPPVVMGKIKANSSNSSPTNSSPALQGDVRVAPGAAMGGLCLPTPNMTAYLADMQAKIKSVWQQPVSTKPRIKVLFKISIKGRVSETKIGTSSGDPQLDKQALAAVKKAAPFDKLPTGSNSSFQAAYTF